MQTAGGLTFQVQVPYIDGIVQDCSSSSASAGSHPIYKWLYEMGPNDVLAIHT